MLALAGDTRGGKLQLEIKSGPDAGRVIRLTGERFTVGRENSCDLVINDSEVSRKHAQFKPLGDGRVDLSDLGSRNGTYVDGRRVDNAVLKGGEELRMGDTTLSTSLEQTVIGQTPGRDAASPVAGPPPPPPARQEPSPPTAPPTEPQPARPAKPRPSAPRPRSPERSQSTIQRLALMRDVRRATIVGIGVGVLVVAVAVLFATGLLGGGDDGGGVNAADVVDKVMPATVLIVADQGGGIGGRGSGAVIDAEEGLVVTNAHVANGGRVFTVNTGDRLRITNNLRAGKDALRARLLGQALCEDLAVLRVRNPRDMRSMPLLDSQSRLRIGESVIAVGYPANSSGQLRADLTGTTGVVSVPRTTFPEVSSEGLLTGPYKNVIQTDTVINEGNSGGPLVNYRGELVGINTVSRTDVQGQFYAIGVDRVRQMVPRLEKGEDVCG